MNKRPKISIIIPIYNVEDYLHQTLMSVTNQTMKDIEIICVNDCATDHSAEILERFAARDERIRCIHHKDNKGAGLARKTGIQAATGEYIMFLDGDDWYDSSACKILYREIKSRGVDMLQFGTQIEPFGRVTAEEIEWLRNFLAPHPGEVRFANAGELVDFCFAKNQFGFSLWNKIYRSDIVKTAVSYISDERFDLAEDLYLFFLIAFHTKSYASVGENYYFYRFGAGITGGKAVTSRVLRNRMRQGLIYKNLEVFAENFDPSGYTDHALIAIKEKFLGDIVFGWKETIEPLDWKTQINTACSCFGCGDVLSEVLQYYYSWGHAGKKQVLEKWLAPGVFANKRSGVKTIGTFYYRVNNGGVERVMAGLIPVWIKQGYRVVLFTDELPSVDDYDYPEEVVRVVLPKIAWPSRTELNRRISYLQDMLERYHVDVMVYHAWVNEYMEADLFATKSAGVPFVVHTHNFFAYAQSSSYVPGVYRNILLEKIYMHCDAVITLTETDYNWWAVIHPRVYKTINPATFEFKKIELAQLENDRVLWLARISPEKRPIDALKILKEVLDSGAETELHIVGKADDEAFYKMFLDAIRDLELEDHVKLHGFRTDVESFYTSSGVFLVTSEYEGFTMTLVESMACGLPVVVYDLPNIDLVRKGEGLRVVEQGDIGGAAKALAEILGDKKLRTQLGQAARKSVEDMYSFDIAKLWNRVFCDVTMDAQVPAVIDLAQLKNAIHMMVDFSALGVEARGMAGWAPAPGAPAAPGANTYLENLTSRENVLRMYRNGEIGFRYIVKYLVAWVKYKLFK